MLVIDICCISQSSRKVYVFFTSVHTHTHFDGFDSAHITENRVVEKSSDAKKRKNKQFNLYFFIVCLYNCFRFLLQKQKSKNYILFIEKCLCDDAYSTKLPEVS